MAQENNIAGQLEAGNIDLNSRPTVKNEDGSISTVRSMSVNFDGQEVLIPTVSPDGKILEDEDAIKLYQETGQHLGKFDTPDNATSYAESLHNAQAEQYVPKAEGPKPWEQMLGRPIEQMTPAVETSITREAPKPWEQMLGRTFGDVSAQQVESFSSAMGPTSFDKVFDKLIQAESKGRHRNSSGRLTTSPVGAQGITQVMPKTGANPGYGVQPLQNDTEEEYIRFGKDYLRAMVNEFGGDMRKAVAAYNAGAGSVQNAVEQAARRGGDWTQYLPKKSETIPYLNRILGEG